MTRNLQPPLALRIAIVVGAVTLLVGIGAAVYLRLFLDKPEAGVTDDLAVVVLTNVPKAQRLQVEATWAEGDFEHREFGAPGTEPGVWSFQRAPVGEDLTLTVYTLDGAKRNVWLQRNVAFNLRERVVVTLPDPPR